MAKGPTISAIAAIGKNRELGKDGKLIWRIQEDMRHFKDVTDSHPVIMGRKTYESIGRALPNRTNIIITRNADYKADDCIVVQSVEDAIKEANQPKAGQPLAGKHDKEEIFIIGGGQIYEQAMHLTDRLYLTIVDESAEADTFFPKYTNYKLINKKEVKTQSKHHISFCTYQR